MMSSIVVHMLWSMCIAVCVLTGAESRCVFPDFLMLRKHLQWMYKVRTNLETPGVKGYTLGVEPSVITFSPYFQAQSQEDEFFTWTCITDLGQESYFIEVRYTEDQSYYQCVSFIHLSNEVKQLKTSEKLIYNNHISCDTNQKELNPWLLVKSGSAPFETVPCSLIGGYDMQIYDLEGKSMCEGLHLVPRLEVGCFEPDKLYVDFQNCPHEIFTPTMLRKQPLSCIATWKEQHYQFIVARRSDKDSYWTFRFPLLHHNELTARLYSDLLADDGTVGSSNINVVELRLRQLIVTNTCSDAAEDCSRSNKNELCTGMYGSIYCKRTCMLCADDTQSSCLVDRKAIGQWQFVNTDITSQATQKFSVCEHNFKTNSLLNTTCLAHEQDYDYHDYVFVKYQDNGCYPRFSCVSTYVTDRVMFIQMSRGATWPQYEENHYCSPRTYDFRPPESIWQVAVKHPALTPVRCNIPMDLYDFHTIIDGVTCHGRLQTSSCAGLTGTGFYITFNKSEPCDLADVHFDCVSSKIYEDSGDKHLTILSRDKQDVFYCFVADLEFTTLVRLPASECHQEFIFWDHTELQTFSLAPSDGICVEPAASVEDSSDCVRAKLLIPLLLCASLLTL